MAVQGRFGDVSEARGTTLPLPPDGLYTREGIYAQTMIIALIPFVNPLYPQSQKREISVADAHRRDLVSNY